VAEESKTAVAAALAGNGALAVLKGIAALSTGSAAMLAETFHSLADTGNQVLLFLGMRRARRAPDRRHPFGYGKDVYFWAFVVSVMLFTLGGAFSIWEGVRHYLHPVEREGAVWAWAVLGGAFVFEAGSLGVALRSLERVREGRPILAFLREARDPTLPTVVLEDSAALVSIGLAGAGIGLSQLTGNATWDAGASAAIGVILIAVAVFLARETHSLLIGERATPAVEAAIREAAGRDPAVAGLASLHTMHLGPESVLVALRVHFRPDLDAEAIAAAVRRIEQAVARVPGLATTRQLTLVEPAESGPAPGPRRRAA
jgi:cation diffusion facilitator family transporter